MASVTERVRWKAIRRGRLSRALIALQDRRTADAFQELNHPGAADDDRAWELFAVGALMAAPSPANAEQCVTVLERVGEERDPTALALAVGVLERVLWQGPGHGPDRVAGIARLSDRVMRLAGPLPWGRYNLAVHALQTGQFATAAQHLSAGAVSPVGGWPLPLLGAACAAVLGDPAALAGSLTRPIQDSDVFHDHRLLFGVHTVFECLRLNRAIQDPAQLDGMFGGPAGPLTRTVPQLAALKVLLAGVVHGVPPTAELPGLDGCLWGRWLFDRLRHAKGEAIEVLSGSGITGDEPPALLWQRAGTQQDLHSLLSEQAAQALRPHFTKLAEGLGDHPAWAPLVEQRVKLTGTSELIQPNLDAQPVPCPWWPAGGVLQTVAHQESGVEHCYLTGRHALRLGQSRQARQWFGTGRARLGGAGMATQLVALRFGPLVDYWDGVALAHLGRAQDATAQLHACVTGVKARDAKAQLGLLAVAGGAHEQAAELLASIPAPRPASADYLATLLAADDPSAMAGLVDHLAQRTAVAGPYLAAAHRLKGRRHETVNELGDAAHDYRQALAVRPGDALASARLARVWLRQRYDDDSVADEPLLDPYWSTMDGALPLMYACFAEPTARSARELLDKAPADPALRLLVVHHAIAAGEDEAAGEALRGWTADDNADPRLVRAARITRAAHLVHEFCRTGEEGPALTQLTQELQAGPTDPVVEFWKSTAQLLLNPEPLAAATPPPTDDWSASMRLFAGVLATFAADPERRRDGATQGRAALDSVPIADDAVRAAVACLIADALGEDRQFLASYKEIETETGLHALPWELAASYLAAVEARLRVGELDEVTDGFIPEPLADLAAPGVRHAMGIAYARRAVRTAEGDARAAMRDLDQARALLTETP